MKTKDLKPGMRVAIKAYGNTCTEAVVLEAPTRYYRQGSWDRKIRLGRTAQGGVVAVAKARVVQGAKRWTPDLVRSFQVESDWETYVEKDKAARERRIADGKTREARNQAARNAYDVLSAAAKGKDLGHAVLDTYKGMVGPSGGAHVVLRLSPSQAARLAEVLKEGN